MSCTLNLNEKQVQYLISKYKDYTVSPTNNYTLFRAKFNSSTITIFKTNTCLIQGKDEYEVYEAICNSINIVPNSKKTDNAIPVIGSLQSTIGTDEVGTGDFFGSIVVAGAFVSKENIVYIKKLGVKDSKELTDYKIMELAPLIMQKIPYAISKLDNLRYNFLTFHHKLNMNNIKALMHNSICNAMKNKVDNYDAIIIDAFTTQNNYFNYLKNEKRVSTDVILEEKAENKYLSVACASIIARYYFVKDLEVLSEKAGFELPKGAGKPVDAAIQKLYNEKGISIFKDISKMKFKNFDKYRNEK